MRYKTVNSIILYSKKCPSRTVQCFDLMNVCDIKKKLSSTFCQNQFDWLAHRKWINFKGLKVEIYGVNSCVKFVLLIERYDYV